MSLQASSPRIKILDQIGSSLIIRIPMTIASKHQLLREPDAFKSICQSPKKIQVHKQTSGKTMSPEKKLMLEHAYYEAKSAEPMNLEQALSALKS